MKKLFYLFTTLFLLTVSVQAQEKYAVLIIGDDTAKALEIPSSHYWNGGLIPPEENNDEFWNDTYLMWEMLQNKGFNPNNIFVLFANGSDHHPEYSRYNPGNTIITNYPARKQYLENLFSDLQNGTNNKPKITEDDFLFVWVFDHGWNTEGHSLFYLMDGQIIDTTFANMVNPILAHRKAFWMQQCHAGGFADDLSASNTVFISASQDYQDAYPADNKTPLGDYILELENESHNGKTYHHGEFNFHMISVVNQESPTHQLTYDDEPYTAGDTNTDNFVSMGEAYQWNLDHNSRATETYNYIFDESEDPVCNDIGCIRSKMSLEYPTLLFDNIGNSETHRGIVGISKDLVVANGQTLTFTGRSNVTLCNSARLIIEDGASLVIDGEVNFQGTNNNLLTIHGNLIQTEGSRLSFSNMQVMADGTAFSIADANFYNTELKYSPAGSSSITGGTALLGSVTVRNCQFHNPSKSYAILVENSRDFDINENTVTACTNNGITITNCGNVTGSNSLIRRVRNNSITGCTTAGLVLYASTGNIYTNHIYGNGIGVKLLNRCNIFSFYGNCAALSETQTQYIHDNNLYEIYMTSNSIPQAMHYNSIHKTNAGSTPFVFCDNADFFSDPPQNERSTIDVSKNEWGNNFNPSIHLYSMSTSSVFIYLPYWGFRDCSEWENPGQRLLSAADSLCDAEAYDTAKLVYRQVIEEFPNTVSAETAMKSLLPLESQNSGDYEALKQYYLTDTIIASQEVLSDLSSHLANRCNEILANYDEAIAWFENIITNPETTYADSIFATIDLGNLYLEMESNGTRAVGKLLQYKPESRPAFEKQCEYALSLLPMQKDNSPYFAIRYVEPLPYWVDTITAQPEGYVMDAEGNVEISSSDGLVWLISAVNGLNGCEPDDFNGRTVRLTQDIDFGETGYDYNFSPIGTRETPFMGAFEGNGHKIQHLRQMYSRYDSIDNYYFDMGIFGYIRHATVKNTTLESTCSISSSCEYQGYYRGGMVGFADSLSIVDNILIHKGISFGYGGTFVGMNRNSTVRNCAFLGIVDGHDYCGAPIVEGGGIVSYNLSEGGYADAVVENCYFYGRIEQSYSRRKLGGIVCFNETTPNNNGKQAIVRNCHCTPTFDFHASYYGTFAAILSLGSGIRNCYADFTRMYQYTNMVGLNEGGEMTDCFKYTNINGVGTLTNPVTLNGTTTDNLVEALNLWIAEQEHPELYRTWTMVTDTVPVFGDYYIGIAENETPANKVKVYPNPASGHVSIQGAEATEVKVYNTLGQCVKTVQNANEISLEGLPQGVYLLRVTTKDGSVFSDKVVKN